MSDEVFVAAAVSLLVAAITSLVTLRAQATRLRTELKTQFMAEEAMRALLEHENWTLRSFGVIRSHMRGFEENELRKLLIRSGALCFAGRDSDVEWWGLMSRNRHRLGVVAKLDPAPPPADEMVAVDVRPSLAGAGNDESG